MAKTTSYVYWLYDNHCVCPWHHGYVGYTEQLDVRIASHRRGPSSGGAQSLPPDFKVQVLFAGSSAEAYAIEEQLRRHSRIGWNVAKGGQKSCSGYKHTEETRRRMTEAARRATHIKGVPKSPEQKAKMRAAALARYADPAEHERTSRAVKKGLTGVIRRPRGPMSKATKQKISNAKRRSNSPGQLDLEF